MHRRQLQSHRPCQAERNGHPVARRRATEARRLGGLAPQAEWKEVKWTDRGGPAKAGELDQPAKPGSSQHRDQHDGNQEYRHQERDPTSKQLPRLPPNLMLQITAGHPSGAAGCAEVPHDRAAGLTRRGDRTVTPEERPPARGRQDQRPDRERATVWTGRRPGLCGQIEPAGTIRRRSRDLVAACWRTHYHCLTSARMKGARGGDAADGRRLHADRVTTSSAPALRPARVPEIGVVAATLDSGGRYEKLRGLAVTAGFAVKGKP